MSTFKKILSFTVILLIGFVVFYSISKKSKNNPGFDDKSAWSGHNDKLKIYEENMKDFSTKIKSSFGNGVCDYDYECRVAGLGIQTCGGYSNFIVYSVKDTDESQLLGFVSDFNQANEKFNELSMNVPGCGEKAKTPYCLNNKCTVR